MLSSASINLSTASIMLLTALIILPSESINLSTANIMLLTADVDQTPFKDFSITLRFSRNDGFIAIEITLMILCILLISAVHRSW